jgi:hypothetical protein
MSDDSVENWLSKFSNANWRAYAPQAGPELQHPASFFRVENNPPLADLLEHAIRGSGLPERARIVHSEPDAFQRTTEPKLLHERLIEELTTAQQQMQSEPPVQYVAPPDYTEPPAEHSTLDKPAPETIAFADREPVSWPELIPPGMHEERMHEETILAEPDTAPLPAAEALKEHLRGKARQSPSAGAGLGGRAKPLAHPARQMTRRMGMRDWNRRRLALLSHIHRDVFDRTTEQLLFCKTPQLEVYHFEETEKGLQKFFVYEGPIPKKLLDWALSALPEDLKRYAFVDFRATNGRTLLLAARRNFEYAAGYAFDAEGAETLEMNLAQYPRSYLACRDVRALRGDRDGVVVPSQPAVLFFPDSLSAGHLDIILNYVTASLRLDPRPIYLIFENAGRECGKDQMSLFERAPMPLLNQAKAFLFAPVSIAVYRSKIEIAN